jgi:hypothetical protein
VHGEDGGDSALSDKRQVCGAWTIAAGHGIWILVMTDSFVRVDAALWRLTLPRVRVSQRTQGCHTITIFIKTHFTAPRQYFKICELYNPVKRASYWLHSKAHDALVPNVFDQHHTYSVAGVADGVLVVLLLLLRVLGIFTHDFTVTFTFQPLGWGCFTMLRKLSAKICTLGKVASLEQVWATAPIPAFLLGVVLLVFVTLCCSYLRGSHVRFMILTRASFGPYFQRFSALCAKKAENA